MDILLERAQNLASKQELPYSPIENRIAYVVSHGQSYASNGYAIRTQGIAKALNEQGLETLCFVRQGRPWDIAANTSIDYEVTVDGVRYFHSNWPQKKPNDELKQLELSVQRFIELFRVYRPSVVLAASNFIVGLPAWVAAKQLNIPFYNEVRGFWELSRDAREPGYAKTQAFKVEAARDIFVAKQALKVFTLNLLMKSELVKRGVAAAAIELVPNGVSKLPEIRYANPALKAKLGIADTDEVIGYIGSINAYEGIEALIEACNLLVEQGCPIKLLIVGDNQPLSSPHYSAAQEDDRSWLIQVGRVAHTDVADYYALVNTIVIPRKKLAVCELVPPLKALEGLAFGKRLVVSELAPFTEYSDNYDGVVSVETCSAKSLATAIKRTLKLPAPKSNTDLLFSAHIKPMVQALKGEGSAPGQKATPETLTKSVLPTKLMAHTSSVKEKAEHSLSQLDDNTKIRVDVNPKISNLVNNVFGPGENSFSELAEVLRENVPPPKVVNKVDSASYNVLTIMDEFTQDCFKDEFNLVPAEKVAWREQLDSHDFDMFFAESAWRGNGATWNYCMSKIKGKFGAPLLELLLECKRRKIPTVFWNKEDPVNYDVFIDAAKCFDYVFTTDATVIDQYKRDVGHNRVYLLKFAAQEKLHSPLFNGGKNGRVAFAGSWNGEKYPTRAERLEMLFEYPLKKGILDIYDRYSSLENAAPGLTYPEKYKASLLPAVPYNKIADVVYKKYSVMINVNSVEDSSSMLARRIYELCGCGTPIVSSPANSLKNELSEIVQVANTPQESREKIFRILNDDIHALKLAAKGVRFVHSANTYRHRFSEILDKVAVGREVKDVQRFSVTAVCVSKRPWFASNVARMLKAQTGVDVKVIYVAHGEETNEEEINEAFGGFESFKFMRISGENKVLADGLNLALDSCSTDIVAKIDDDDHYGPNYLLDSCLALQYSCAALVGKTSFFCYVESTNDFALRFPGKHYRYFKRVQGGTLVWSREKTGNLKFTQVRQGTDSIFIKDLLDSGRKVFSSDPFNFVHVRYASGNNHTWAIEDDKFLETANIIGKGLKLDYAFN